MKEVSSLFQPPAGGSVSVKSIANTEACVMQPATDAFWSFLFPLLFLSAIEAFSDPEFGEYFLSLSEVGPFIFVKPLVLWQVFGNCCMQ